MAGLIDWDVAARAAKRLSPPPPGTSRHEAEETVSDLYRATAVAADQVAELTQLHEPPVTAITRVIDRAAWVDTNAGGMRTLMDPLVERLSGDRPMGKVAQSVGGRVTGVQVGVVLGFLSGKVLGQFEFFERPGGQLLLVAPNLVAVERQLKVDSRDFRLWVCLHEETHRVQFTAVPWMRDHIHAQIAQLIGGVDLDPAKMAAMVAEAVRRISEVVRGNDDVSLLDLFSTPEQRVVMDRVTGVMSLLEGHADVVMDGVGPGVIPSVDKIRRKFDERRKGVGYLDRVLRRLLGLDVKMAQYRDGAAFVRAVVDKVGMDGFNAVWSEPDTLPSKAEIADPGAWVRRVHG